MKESLREYFVSILSNKSGIIKQVTKELAASDKAKNDNENHETTLRGKLSKAQKSRQKFMDMYTDDLISREELRERVATLNIDIEKLENELKIITYDFDRGNRLEGLPARTFTTIDDVVSMGTLNNAQLKSVLQKIVASHSEDGRNVDVYLKLFGDLSCADTPKN